MDSHIFIFILVGFLAQIIDGALGMAYGVISSAFLLTIGVPPALASASVHFAEIFTTGLSGLCHLHNGNVDIKLSRRLLLGGITGGIVGAYILTNIPGEKIKPFVAVYLGIMGLMILRKAFKRLKHVNVKTHLIPLGLVGGFFDAVGGGGWGPIVTSSLVARGHDPRFAIGSVNLVEFFVTLAQSATFFLLIGTLNWSVVLGLLIGGILAAPIAAYMCKRLPARALLIGVGVLIVLLSAQMLFGPYKSPWLTGLASWVATS